MKALIASRDLEYPTTHNLVALVDLIQEDLPEVAEFSDRFALYAMPRDQSRLRR